MKQFSLPPSVALATLLSLSCSDAKNNAEGDSVNGTAPAVIMGMRIESPEGRLIYVGAFSDVPSGEVGTDNMVEFGNVYTSVYDGYLYVFDRDNYEIIKYGFSDDLKFVNLGTLSFQAYGSGFEFGNAFASPTRALIPHLPSDKLIVWDPSTMRIVDTKPLNMPVREGMDTFPGDPVVSGGTVAWPIISMNEEAGTLYPVMAAMIAPTDGSKSPTLIEDERCLPGIQGMAGGGDIYMVGEGYSGNSNWWVQSEAPPACVLRIQAGKAEFDPGYFLDLNTATGSPAIAQSFRMNDTHLLLRVWDPGTPLPELEHYWEGTFVSKLVDLADPEAAATAFDAIPPGGVTSNVQTSVDGVSYLELPLAGGGNKLYELHSDSIKPVFEIPGDIWVLARAR